MKIRWFRLATKVRGHRLRSLGTPVSGMGVHLTPVVAS